ncbi:uncharacterized [Tachysurus ichikawai]
MSVLFESKPDIQSFDKPIPSLELKVEICWQCPQSSLGSGALVRKRACPIHCYARPLKRAAQNGAWTIKCSSHGDRDIERLRMEQISAHLFHKRKRFRNFQQGFFGAPGMF